mgnify:FL=1
MVTDERDKCGILATLQFFPHFTAGTILTYLEMDKTHELSSMEITGFLNSLTIFLFFLTLFFKSFQLFLIIVPGVFGVFMENFFPDRIFTIQ